MWLKLRTSAIPGKKNPLMARSSGFRRRILNDCRAGSRCFAGSRRRAWEQVLCRFPAAMQVQMRDNIVFLCSILDRVLISRKGADRKQRYSQAKSKQYGCKFLHVFHPLLTVHPQHCAYSHPLVGMLYIHQRQNRSSAF